MMGKKLAGMFMAAALVMGISASSADAAVVARHSSAAVRVNPGHGHGHAVHHTGKTSVHATPARPGVGPTVKHTSRTAVRR